MKRNLQKKLTLVLLITCFFTLFSCKKTFDIKPLSEVDVTQDWRNVTDVNSAILGVYGKLLGVAEQYIVLNELRGDLMDVTPNADKYLQEISQHHVTIGNPWGDPRPYFTIILNCNDILYHMNIMLAQNLISVADYNYRYSDIGALRTWMYYQLAIHFGTVPYVTDPLSNINDLKDQSKFPRLDLQTMLSKLVPFMQSLPWLDPYPNVITLINGSTTTTTPTPATISGFPITHNFVDKHLVLGDLLLMQAAYGHPENYTLAATQYRFVLEYVKDYQTNGTYRIEGTVDFTNYNDFGVDYQRWREQDINQLKNTNTQGWRSMFGRAVYPTYDTKLDAVWVWQMFYPQAFQPVDPFVDLFSQQGGRYLVQPSQTMINYWNSQTQSLANSGVGGNANFTTFDSFDARFRLSVFDPTGNYNSFNNQNVIMKNLYTYQDNTVSQSNKYGRWFLYRDATLNLRYAECANRDGYGILSYAVVNNGLITNFNPYNYSLTPTNTGNGPALPATTSLGNVPNGDNTNIMQTFYPAPYDIDARSGTTPYFRSGWYQNAGIRGRANVTSYNRTATIGNVVAQEDEMLLEGALEVAFEGHRWEDLLRFAIRRGDAHILADKVYDKLSKDGYPGAATAQATLLTNYYLPFNW